MTSAPPQSPPKPPPTTRFIKAMGPGLHEHFDATADETPPAEMLRALKQVDRRHLMEPKGKH